MVIQKKKITAQQARDIQYTALNTRARKLYQDAPQANLTAPAVPNALAPDNLLPFDQVEHGMDVEIPRWSYNDDDELYVYWNEPADTDKGSPIFKAIYPTAPTFPVTFKVEPGVLGGGTSTNTLSYKVVRNSGQDNVSDVTIVKVDTRPPGHGVQLPAPVVDSTEVTPEYLAANNDVLKATIPAWASAFEAGVVITPFYNYQALTPVLVTQDDVDAGEVSFDIPGDMIRKSGEGILQTYYIASSRAGYDSARSRTAPVVVYLTESPTGLQAPLVPLADDGLIDLEDIDAGVVVNIPAFQHFQASDTITVHWGGQTLAAVPVGSGDFPVPIAVLRSLIIAEGSGTVDVYYVITRDSRTFTSPSTSVEVDITTVGPVDPNPETPENEALLPPTIKGGASGQDNVLTPEDKGLNATATIPFYSENVAAGQVIKLYWGKAPAASVFVGEYTITAEDITNQAFPAITVPARIVDATGNNPSLQVYYTIQASAAADPVNPVLSMPQTVRVRLTGPGGPGGLTAAVFPDVNSRGWLLLAAVEKGANVTVSVYEQMKIGDIVTIKWMAYSDTNTATPIMETEYTSPQVTVTQVEIANGVKFVVPYNSSIFPILAASASGQGSAKVVYTVEQDGDTFTSAEATVKIDLKKPES